MCLIFLKCYNPALAQPYMASLLTLCQHNYTNYLKKWRSLDFSKIFENLGVLSYLVTFNLVLDMHVPKSFF